MVALCPHRHPGERRRWSPPAGSPRRYERRRPEKTPLCGVVAARLESWLESRQARDEAVAGYVEDEFGAFLHACVTDGIFMPIGDDTLAFDPRSRRPHHSRPLSADATLDRQLGRPGARAEVHPAGRQRHRRALAV